MTTINVVFEDVWLTDVTDPTISVHASSPERAHAFATDGEVRFYGKRRRVITTDRKSATFPVVLQWLTVPDLAQIEAWQGQVVLLRDPQGRRVFGTFFAGDVTDRYLVGGWRSVITLTFTEVDFDESV